MLNFIQKRKDQVSVVKAWSSKRVNRFSAWQLLTFALICAGIGGFIIWRSLAATIPPTTPALIKTDPVSSSEIDLSWGASTSDAVIAGYNIYQVVTPVAEGGAGETSDELVGQTSDSDTTTFKLTGLESATNYQFYVEARDTQGNLSAPSNQVLASTLDDSNLPLGFAARNGTTSTWPYKGPFGDKSAGQACRKDQTGTGTPAVYTGCMCQPVSGVVCDGSCVYSINDTVVDNSVIGCRPGGVFKLFADDTRETTIISNVQDEGVDYNATGNGTYGIKLSFHTPAYIYAMGKGTIISVKRGFDIPAFPGNGSFGPNWMAYKLHFNGPNGTADGLKIYVSEYCTLASNAIRDVTATSGTGTDKGDRYLGRRWQVNDEVTANSILCTMDAEQKPVNGDKDSSGKLWSRGIETGWAAENTQGFAARAADCYSGLGHIPTQFGFSFSQFIHQSGGPKGLSKGYKNGHLYNYYYNHNGTTLRYHTCSDFNSTKDYKGNWYS